MKALQMLEPTEEQQSRLAEAYRTTQDVRIRTRGQMVLLACEQHLSVPNSAAIVREDAKTVRLGSNVTSMKELKDCAIDPGRVLP